MALDALHDQTLQDLVLQGLVIGHLDAARLQFTGNAERSLAQFTQRDHILVDHGRDAIDELLAFRSGSRSLRGGLGAIACGPARLLGRMRGGQAGAKSQQQRAAGQAAQRVQPTHHSYLSNVVPAGTGGVMLV
ncbi:hypothetical protein G6F63_014945 [Rhizopus arrhizus]|nr:hypothetical protein G6F63_014945 [Rhizopus arrhizus]